MYYKTGKNPKKSLTAIIGIIVTVIAAIAVFLGAFVVVSKRIVVGQDYYCTPSCRKCNDCIQHTVDVTLWDKIRSSLPF